MSENIEMANVSNSLLLRAQGNMNEQDESNSINVRIHHRTTSMHRNVDNAQTRTMPRDLEQRRNWVDYDRVCVNELEHHAKQIADRMERDKTLNQNNIISEQLRKEALRSMPQLLTVKRRVKVKLTHSVNITDRHKSLPCFKRWKYMASMKLSKMVVDVKNSISFFELWYSTLKQIEGNFGSGISSYFIFFRWLFCLNVIVTIVSTIFIIVPQLIFANSTNLTAESKAPFSVNDIFTGEGYFTNSILYYGSYSNESMYISDGLRYNIPYAYFLTMIAIYAFYLLVFGSKFASSYRESYIETRSGLKNVFANKIFCSWDFSIATLDGATLKHSALYHELRELIAVTDEKSHKIRFMTRVHTFFIRLTLNSLIFMSIAGVCYSIWYLLDDTAPHNPISTAIVVNLAVLAFPRILKYVSKYEDYKTPKVTLFANLSRLFALEMAIIVILIIFWTGSRRQNCWETFLGQEVYRLIFYDFVFSIMFTLIFEVGRFVAHKYLPRIDCQVFDVAGHTAELVYNQTLLWVGLYFAPSLAVVVTVKTVATWYIKSRSLLHCCRPTSKTWRASEANALFLMLSLVSLLAALSAIGYIIYNIDSSACGPLPNGIKGILPFAEDNVTWHVVTYVFKPGSIGIAVVALCALIYYQRARARVQKGAVDTLREMLVLEAKDKEYLLSRISQITKGEWQYNLQDGRHDLYDPYKMMPLRDNRFGDRNNRSGAKEKSV